jgi:hypothetical protein
MSLLSTRSIQDELWSRSKRIQAPFGESLRVTFANSQRSFDEQNRQLLSDNRTRAPWLMSRLSTRAFISHLTTSLRFAGTSSADTVRGMRPRGISDRP